MKKRRILASIALAAAAAFSLASCNGDAESTTTTAPAQTTTTTQAPATTTTTTVVPTTTSTTDGGSATTTTTTTTTSTTQAAPEYDPNSTIDVNYNVLFDNYVGEKVPSTGFRISNVVLADGNVAIDGNNVTYDGTNYRRISNIKGTTTSPAVKIEVPTAAKVTMLVSAQGNGKRTLSVVNSKGKALAVKVNGTEVANGQITKENDTNIFVLEVEVDDEDTIGLAGTNGFVLLNVVTEYSMVFGEYEGIEVLRTGRTDYVQGIDFDGSKVEAVAKYENGDIYLKPGEFTIDSSAFDKTTAGTYPIKVKKDGKEASFDTTVIVADGLELGMYLTAKASKNSSAGNGQYVTNRVKTIYATTDTALDTTYLTPYALQDDGGKIIKNALKISDTTVTGFTAGQAGKQTITITVNNVSATYDIFVVDTQAYKNDDGDYVVTVDQNYTGTIGAVDGTNGNMFTTIGQALEFIQNEARIAKTENKILNIKAGYYNEKLEITAPNITIVGEGICKGTYSKDENYDATEFAQATVIEYAAVFGVVGDDNFMHVTDSTGTVAVRDTATNCTFKNITISNAYNCLEYFDDKLGEKYSEHRALALLVQADTFKFIESSLLGFQDTLELFYGRQYFKDCYISGTTDFIFGTNNTTYFDSCEIHTINNGTQGGYVNAFKGLNTTYTADSVLYGAIYNHCNFTADSDVPAGKTAIARPWADGSAVMVMNSNLGAHISKTEYSGQSQDARYVSMNANPDNANVKFTEYNNSGVGAISASQTGVTVLTKTEADNYADFSKVFGTTNGKVKYNVAWDPTDGLAADDNTYYWFHGVAPTTGVVKELDSQYDNTTLNDVTLGAVTFTNCYKRTEQNGDVRVDGSVTIHVKAGSTVTINTYKDYHGYKIGDVYANADSATFYFATEDDYVLEKAGSESFYLYSIIINEKLPASTAKIASLELSGTVVNAEVGEKINISALTAKGIQDNGTYVNLASADYTVSAKDPSDNEFDLSTLLTTAGTYKVTVTLDSDTTVKEEYDVIVTQPVDYIALNTRITFGNGGNYTTNSKVTFSENAVGGLSGDNIANQVQGTIKFNVGAGAIINITAYNKYTNYSIVAGSQTADSDITDLYHYYQVTSQSEVTITCGANNYLQSIDIIYPISTTSKFIWDKDQVDSTKNEFVLTGTSADGISFVGSYNTNNAIQFKDQQEYVLLAVNEGASVTINGHSGGYGDLKIYAGTSTTAFVQDATNDYIWTYTAPVGSGTVIIKIMAGGNGTNGVQFSYLRSIAVSYE